MAGNGSAPQNLILTWFALFVITLSRIYPVYSDQSSVVIPATGTLENDNVTCGDLKDYVPYLSVDGTPGACGVTCPPGRRNFNQSLAYFDVLAGHTLANLTKPTPRSPGRGYDSRLHRRGLKSEVYIKSTNMTFGFWIYVERTRNIQNWVIQFTASLYITVDLYITRSTPHVINIQFNKLNGRVLFTQSTWTLAARTWTHIAVQLSSSTISLFINGTFIWPAVLHNSKAELAYIDNTLLKVRVGWDHVNLIAQIQDVRIYNYTLSNGEIYHLVTGNESLLHTGVLTDCLCPGTYPRRVDDVSNYCETNPDASNSVARVSRLAPYAHSIDYAFDDVTNTSWQSRPNTTNITITVRLGQVYEVLAIEIDSYAMFPLAMTLSTDESHVTTLAYNCDGKKLPCQVYPLPRTSGPVIVNLNTTNMNGEGLVTSVLMLRMQGFRDPYTQRQYYSIKEIKVYGRCFCNGRSSTCNQMNPLVCTGCENSHGISCEVCEEGYYSDPNKTRNGNNLCQKCNCHFPGIVNVTEGGLCRQEGGQCKCKRHVTGKLCDTCQPGFYNITSLNVDGCEACSCPYEGSTNNICDVNSGKCDCKKNVMGGSCSQCLPGYYNMTSSNPNGCETCSCHSGGSITNICDVNSGKCDCKKYVVGDKCDRCYPGYCKMSLTNSDGCEPCGCFLSGTFGYGNYDAKCICKKYVTGNICDICAPGYYNLSTENPDGCQPCQCHSVGIRDTTKHSCAQNDGSCDCKVFVTSRTCNKCMDGYWGLNAKKKKVPTATLR